MEMPNWRGSSYLKAVTFHFESKLPQWKSDFYLCFFSKHSSSEVCKPQTALARVLLRQIRQTGKILQLFFYFQRLGFLDVYSKKNHLKICTDQTKRKLLCSCIQRITLHFTERSAWLLHCVYWNIMFWYVNVFRALEKTITSQAVTAGKIIIKTLLDL